MQMDIGTMIPAGDGTLLAATIARPDGPGPFPVILVRTCYHRRTLLDDVPGNPRRQFLARGYAVVVQDVRGKFDSDGTFAPLVQEADDGLATLDWIANQPWCDGTIGTYGRSYLGMVQMPAASRQHAALKAVAPAIAPAHLFRDWVRYDGCFALYNMLRWPLEHASCRTQASISHLRWQDAWRCRSVADVERVTGIRSPLLAAYAAHDTDDAFWAAHHQWDLHPRIAVPGLHQAGWFDHISRGQFDHAGGVRARGATELARNNQFLWVGPYSHLTMDGGPQRQRRLGDWDFGPAAVVDTTELELRFFDRFVRGIDNGFDREPRVQLFLLGANRWISFAKWPPPEARPVSWFLAPGCTLSPTAGNADLARSCRFDPADPVLTRGGPIYWGHADQLGNCLGPVDQRPLLSRPDVHYFRSDPLPAPLTIAGVPVLHVAVSTDAEDLDFVAKLCVETPGGEVVCVTLGQLRARYRESFARPVPMPPRQAVPLRVDFHPIAYQFAAGARLGLLVTHSDFPRIEPHPGVIAPPLSGATPQPARHEIHFGPMSRSRLELPVVDGL